MLGKEKPKQGKFSDWKNQSKGKFCEGKIKAKKILYLQTFPVTGCICIYILDYGITCQYFTEAKDK